MTLDTAGHPLHCTERLESKSLGRGSPEASSPRTRSPWIHCRSPLPQQEAVTVGEASFKTGGGSAGQAGGTGPLVACSVFQATVQAETVV